MMHAAAHRTASRSSRAVLHGCHRRNARLVRAAAVSAPAPQTLQHELPDGVKLELVHQAAAQDLKRPPLLFVHGSYHAAWCWQEYWMPYFAAAGYDCWAVSLRAQGGSGGREGARGGGVAGTLDTHATDLGGVVAALPGPPVLVAHSFGGLIAQQYLLRSAAQGAGAGALPDIAGLALLGSVPPSGNKQLVGRFLRRDPLLSLRITWSFVAKAFATNEAACRESFFSTDLPQEDLKKYQALLAACSPVRLLDLKDMNARVPLPPPPRPQALPPVYVAGGRQDKVVDVDAVEELARYYGVEPVLLPDTAHDVMLDTRWEAAAASLRGWLDSLPPGTAAAGSRPAVAASS